MARGVHAEIARERLLLGPRVVAGRKQLFGAHLLGEAENFLIGRVKRSSNGDFGSLRKLGLQVAIEAGRFVPLVSRCRHGRRFARCALPMPAQEELLPGGYVSNEIVNGPVIAPNTRFLVSLCEDAVDQLDEFAVVALDRGNEFLFAGVFHDRIRLPSKTWRPDRVSRLGEIRAIRVRSKLVCSTPLILKYDQNGCPMKAATFWKTVTMDGSDLLGKLVELLERKKIRYCVIGGQGVNAYVEPLVSLDLDFVVAAEQLESFSEDLASFGVETFAHSIILSLKGSDLRAQIQTDPRYAPFVDRAEVRSVLGMPMRVARIEDVLQGKVWAALDDTRRKSKRLKDFADIARIIESFPKLESIVPDSIRKRLI